MTNPIATIQTPILPLNSEAATLQLAGGKGANLARLARLGFPVPPGFLITTQGYQSFITANSLEERIQAVLAALTPSDVHDLETASESIRALFSAGEIPSALADELLAAYARLGRPAVAVRSSATAEDLPDMSFAGQQDTFLNVVGDDALLKAVVDCWSSLWTARAIRYRAYHHIPHEGIALAVVIQEMVESQVSGVLFTANPLTGLRTETVIDATFGLGEALVSGQVEPDHYVVDMMKGCIITKTLGAKALSIRSQTNGGTQVMRENLKERQALTDEHILALAHLGQQVADLYAFPQDIEWAVVQDKLHLLQSRPITSLFPVSVGMPPEPLKVLFSFGAVQGMLDPFTPLGYDSLRLIFAAAASLFGIRVTAETQTVLYSAGERLWLNITTLLHNSIGRKVVHGAFKFVEPTVLQALDAIWDDPRLMPGKSGISFHARTQLARFLIPMAGNVVLNMLSPAKRRQMIIDRGEKILTVMSERCAAISGDRKGGDRYSRLAQLAVALPDMSEKYLLRMMLLFISGVASGVASLNLVNVLSSNPSGEATGAPAGGWSDLVMEVTRGVAHNPTTEMDLALWNTACAIRGDPASWQAFKDGSTAELTALYLADRLPDVTHRAIEKFLAKYGGRGLGEIDMGRPRWFENPAPVFEMLGGYLHIEDPDKAPDAIFKQSAVNAGKAVERLVSVVRQSHRGWLKARLVRFFAGRVRELLGLRESPKFFAVRMMGLLRQGLLSVGQEFVQAGELEQVDDLLYLYLAELRSLAAREPKDWKSTIARRRETYQRELLRRQIPRLLLSDGRAFYEGISAASDDAAILTGSPVSPGSVEGKVRVVFDPHHANLLPGEIMVCPGTDPSWTPLFLTAAGLIMETGGMMTHGAVVAREYGIPAVVGVDQATQRLQTGQFIKMNGSTGQIVIQESGKTAGE